MNNISISSLFKNVVLLSGTPDCKQRSLSYDHFNNTCSCSPRTAMDNGWICRPTLNLVNCSGNDWPSAVKTVYEREVELFENDRLKLFKPVILVNCKSIDDVVTLRETTWFKERAGNEFHFISIHSNKTIDNDGSIDNVTAEIDGERKTAAEAYEAIESIDDGVFDKPVIVAQVQMIGEGINVKSFTSVITSSNCDKTAMQQIGRVLRDMKICRTEKTFEIKNKSGFFNKLFKRTERIELEIKRVYRKVEHGHANVYVINDNLDNITSLIVNLGKFDLTDDCFDWGKRIDVKGGSKPEPLVESESCKLNTPDWLDIDSTDPQIIEILNEAKTRSLKESRLKWLLGADNNDDGIPDYQEFIPITERLRSTGYIEVVSKRKSKTSPEELFNILMDILEDALKNQATRSIWNISHKAAMSMIFQNKELAEFFETRLSKEAIYQLSR